MGGNGAEDGANKAGEDTIGSGGSSIVKGSAALDGAAVAAVGDGGGDCRGSEGSSDEENDFGEHL